MGTLKERRDYLCKIYFTNMQAPSHKVNCLLPEKGTLIMIGDKVICINNRYFGQMVTVIHQYPGDYTTGNDYIWPIIMIERYKMCEILYIKKVCSCTFAPFCQDVWRLDVILCCVNPTFDLPINLHLILS